MRNVTILLLFSSITLSVAAQGVFSNQTNMALQKVIEDYPNHFRNIKGDKLPDYTHSVAYKSKVQIPGSVNCILTEYNTRKDAYSWQCNLFASGDFTKAKSRYSEIYNQVHNTIIKVEGEKPVILNGKYEVPDEQKKYSSILFKMLPATGLMERLKVELTLENENNKWNIVLKVYEHEGHGDFAAEQ